MGRSKDLADLISVLDKADSPFERLHQLALAWRSIRRMSPGERLELARKAGFDGAESIVERLAGRYGGLAPALLLQAIQRARKADSGELEEIFRQLGDPGRRAEMVSKGIRLAGETLDQALEEEVGAAPEPHGRTAGAPESGGAQSREEPPAPAAAVARDAPETEHKAETAMANANEPATEPDDREIAGLPPGGEGPPVEAPAGSGDSPPPAEDGPVMESSPEVDREPDGGGHDEAPAGLAPRAPAAVEPLVRRLRREDSVIRRLDLLRREAPLGHLDAQGVESVLAEFPWSWARRRALCFLIEGGTLDGMRHPEALLVGLARGDRRWCLTSLAQRAPVASWKLDDLLGSVESPALRNRLRRLAQVSPGG